MASHEDVTATVVTNGTGTNGTDTNGFGARSPTQMIINSTIEQLQSDEQRRVLDIVSQVRKCGLESVLSLPQIVVCGDQSSGKSSVLEALTEIPFPRNDNLCTRFATEICLRRERVDSLTVHVIPGSDRPQEEQEKINDYSESITNFAELPKIMEKAMNVMGISEGGNAIAQDTLSIEICGPNRPQLTLVDIPGLIQTSTKGVSDSDVAMVAEITHHYIKQPRTICIPVIAATNDAANQAILQKVRKYDAKGERTLGVITKPDCLNAGSGSEKKFLELAQNEDVFFKLGWHVVKNRKFEEMHFSIDERNLSEKAYFSTSNFKMLSKENVGVEALRARLSYLLFEHIKVQLPRLQKDLEFALDGSQEMLGTLGKPRSTAAECRAFLTELSMELHETCRAALTGNYDHPKLKMEPDYVPNPDSKVPLRRLRAFVQWENNAFAKKFNIEGHKYIFKPRKSVSKQQIQTPQFMSKDKAKSWVEKKIRHSRGTELIGNFNPQVIAELFWEQSEPWEAMARTYVEKISRSCELFLEVLLKRAVTSEIKQRIWASLVVDFLKARKQAAFHELAKIIKDKNNVPINYNHYYTDTVHKKRVERVERTAKPTPLNEQLYAELDGESSEPDTVTAKSASCTSESSDEASRDMEAFGCEEALDCLNAIYKVQKKVFVANVTTQVIERHLLADLNEIFSPMVVLRMDDSKVQNIVSEPESRERERTFLLDRIKRLQEGREILRSIMIS